MSVGLLVQFKSPDREAIYKPVATAAAYDRYWISAAGKLRLPWLLEFETGTTIPFEALPAVIAEFEQLRPEFTQRPEADWLLERLDNVLDVLRGLDLTDVEDIFIG